MRSSVDPGSLYTLEQMAAGHTALHRLHPMAKLAGTLCYLICILSLPLLRLTQLMGFILYPAVLMALGEIPAGLLLRRTAVALPFCAFAGLANLLLDRRVLFMLAGVPVTAGLLGFLSILIRTVLCVSAVLILVAVTPFSAITAQLRRLHVPGVLISLLEMTYRYAGTLAREAGRMVTAYRLRSGQDRGVGMGHMGSFVGTLLLKSYDRAERVYQAMCCRGYGGGWSPAGPLPMTGRDLLGLGLLCLGPVLLRLVDLPGLLGRLLTCWM